MKNKTDTQTAPVVVMNNHTEEIHNHYLWETIAVAAGILAVVGLVLASTVTSCHTCKKFLWRSGSVLIEKAMPYGNTTDGYVRFCKADAPIGCQYMWPDADGTDHFYIHSPIELKRDGSVLNSPNAHEHLLEDAIKTNTMTWVHFGDSKAFTTTTTSYTFK